MNELVKIENNEIVVTEQSFIDEYANYLKWKKETELKDKEFKQALADKMEQLGKKSINVGKLIITLKKATTRTSIDTKKLKEELPDVYQDYSKTTPVASSVVISVLD